MRNCVTHMVRRQILWRTKIKSPLRSFGEKYWRGAQIEEFDALSPEYAIRIEQK